MTQIGKVKVPMVEIIRDLTVKVSISGLRITRMRLKLAGWFIKLGCKIAGTKCDLEVVE